MILALVRHGQTDYNNKRLIQGLMDNPLNKTGIKQAKELGKSLFEKDKIWDLVGSSSLSRASKTAKILARKIRYFGPFFIDDNLIERDFGPFEGQGIDETIPKILEPNFSHENYENDELLMKRVKDGVMNMYQTFKNKKILFVTHSHVIKSLLILVNDKKYDYKTLLNNMDMIYFEIDADGIKIMSNDKWL